MFTIIASDCLNDELYPYPAIRAPRIIRESGKRLGDFQLTADVVSQLQEDQTGVLIANCGDTCRIHRQLLTLADAPYPSHWLVVVSSIELARIWYAEQHGTQTRRIGVDSPASTWWQRNNCTFTRLESLSQLAATDFAERPLAGIILVDPTLRTQTARGDGRGNWRSHDRPELMNEFRRHLEDCGQTPPLITMAIPPAKSMNTMPFRRAYMLQNLWFADGASLRTGEPPQLIPS